MVEMELVRVGVEPPTNVPVVLLRERNGAGRVLPISSYASGWPGNASGGGPALAETQGIVASTYPGMSNARVDVGGVNATARRV